MLAAEARGIREVMRSVSIAADSKSLLAVKVAHTVVRGGSWLVHANRTRADFRDFLAPDERRVDVGHRVVSEGGAP